MATTTTTTRENHERGGDHLVVVVDVVVDVVVAEASLPLLRSHRHLRYGDSIPAHTAMSENQRFFLSPNQKDLPRKIRARIVRRWVASVEKNG